MATYNWRIFRVSENRTYKRVIPYVRCQKQKYEYGINGLAKLLGCSRTTASKIKSSGVLDDAIFQVGKTIIIDKEKALELFNNSNKNNKDNGIS